MRLTIATAVHPLEADQSEIKIYPNPMTDKSTLLISAPDAGDATIIVCDIAGKIVSQIESYIDNNTQEFILSGFKKGIYIIQVKGNTYQFSGKLISNGKSNGIASIEKLSDNIIVDNKAVTKGVMATLDMEYAAGDILKFTAVSGNFITVITDIAIETKTIEFNFIACSDGDGNNYQVVEIGTGKSDSQIWMAENLKTTKYNDGTDIALVADSASWINLSTPGYCWYDNNEAAYKNTYGALYNWYAVNTGKLCPSGWHVPTDTEWATLAGPTGWESVTGGKFRETGTEHWTPLNTGATNETGFTALPGGYRHDLLNSFTSLNLKGHWWTSTEVIGGAGGNISAWNRELTGGADYILKYNYNKKSGLSVRCIQD